MLVTKYWDVSEIGLKCLENNLIQACEELKKYEEYAEEGSIAEIHIEDSYGIYIPQILFSMFRIYSEEDYPFEIGSEDEILATDELIEEIDEELQLVIKEFDLLPEGYSAVFGWHDGEIRTVVYNIEG